MVFKWEFIFLLSFTFILSIADMFKNIFNKSRTSLCWCDDLRNKIEYSRKLLVDRYGLNNLESSTVFATSGSQFELENRLFKTLEYRKVFRIGIKGGSFSLPEIDYGNAWSFNVTRWLNFVLSSSECNDGKNDFRNELYGNCFNDLYTTFTECRLPQMESRKAVFCSKNNAKSESSYVKHRLLDTICDNSILPHRHCLVFGGSGKVAVFLHLPYAFCLHYFRKICNISYGI